VFWRIFILNVKKIKDEFRDGKASLAFTEFAQNALDCEDDSRIMELGRAVQRTFTVILMIFI